MQAQPQPNDGVSNLARLVLVPPGEVVDVRYEAMCRAIAECERVDEIKEIHDKALALELYCRQALNQDAERAATQIRLRAERRAGELLRDMAKAKGAANGEPGPGRGNKTQSQDATTFSADYADAPEPPAKLADMGISRTQSSRWQQLATVPEEQFEAALNDRYAPLTTARLITLAPGYEAPPAPVSPLAGVPMETVMLVGFFREFANSKLPGYDVAALMAHVQPHTRAKLHEWMATLDDFIDRVRSEL